MCFPMNKESNLLFLIRNLSGYAQNKYFFDYFLYINKKERFIRNMSQKSKIYDFQRRF